MRNNTTPSPQPNLFEDLAATEPAQPLTQTRPLATPRPAARHSAPSGPAVQAAQAQPQHLALREQLGELIRIGASSWSFPGWAGIVYANTHTDAVLAKTGLAAYAQHPLLRTVSLDRSFYRPLTQAQYADYARQLPSDFRMVVKAPAMVCDAVQRDVTGRQQQSNPLFLDPQWALQEALAPCASGLGARLGAVVFQISPLPSALRADMPAVLRKLDALLSAVSASAWNAAAPQAYVAVEVRDPAWLTPEFARILKAHGATYCLGLHAKMPPIEAQLPMLRALWPGPLLARWSLNARHGAHGYAAARQDYAPFNALVHDDHPTRLALAKVMAATARAGHQVLVTINNKAEGCAPHSAVALAQEVAAELQAA